MPYTHQMHFGHIMLTYKIYLIPQSSHQQNTNICTYQAWEHSSRFYIIKQPISPGYLFTLSLLHVLKHTLFVFYMNACLSKYTSYEIMVLASSTLVTLHGPFIFISTWKICNKVHWIWYAYTPIWIIRHSKWNMNLGMNESDKMINNSTRICLQLVLEWLINLGFILLRKTVWVSYCTKIFFFFFF